MKVPIAIATLVILVISGVGTWHFWPSPKPRPYISLAQARADHETQLRVRAPFDDVAVPAIQHPKLDFSTYQGPLGEMQAIATIPQPDAKRRPALVYITGGFGGLQLGFDVRSHPSHDLSVVSFLEQDIVLFLPALRGENGNPGVFECFYGEVDDIIAAVEHVKQRPDVDPEQVYLMGYGTGATNVLLAACLTNAPKQVIALSGCVELQCFIDTYGGYDGMEPFDTSDSLEVRLRSPVFFTREIKVPTLYIEGEHSPHKYYGEYMWGLAEDHAVPYRAVIIPGAIPTNYLRPVNDMLANCIANNLPMPAEHEIISEYRTYFTRTSP